MSNGNHREARTFFVETRFQRMARRPGGVTRAEAVKNAQAEIEESKPEFEAWLDNELQALVDLTRNVRAGVAEPNWRDTICSHSRQLRDIGTTVGFALVTFIAGNLCDILESPQAGSDRDMELIACHVDSLLLARQSKYRDLRPDQLPELSEGLRRVAESMRMIEERTRNERGET